MPVLVGSFAEQCYNNNSSEELEKALISGPDKKDMEQWSLTPRQWQEQVVMAMMALNDIRK